MAVTRLKSGFPERGLSILSTSVVRSGKSASTVGPRRYSASRPGDPSAVTTGSLSRRLERGLKTDGRSFCGMVRGRKPVEVVMVKGSAEGGIRDGEECRKGKRSEEIETE